MGTEQAVGLRERSKARRRAEIQQAGMRLFAERGYLNTTVVDIAEAAEVAPRTVSGYFATKIDIATAFADDIARGLSAHLVDGPATDLIAALDAWLVEVEDSLDTETARLAKAMYEANPELRSLGSGHVADAAEAGAAAIARSTGLDVGDPMVAIAGAALGAVVAEYLNAMASGTAGSGLHESVIGLLRTVLDGVRADATSPRRRHEADTRGSKKKR